MHELGAEFSLGKPSLKPGFALRFRTATVLSQIRIWNTGEADHKVMDHFSGEFIYNVAGLLLDDTTFEAAFDDFHRRTAKMNWEIGCKPTYSRASIRKSRLLGFSEDMAEIWSRRYWHSPSPSTFQCARQSG